MRKNYNSYEDLKFLMAHSGKTFDIEQIDKAYKFALVAHGSQVRKSNEPYIVHPVSVACILVELGMDTDSIIAALLHDVVEDTPVTLDEIKENFGEDIMQIIDGLTKINKVSTYSKEERKAETIRKILIAMSENLRVIIIKLADRLNNMRTLDALSPQKQRDIALETMEVYAPIAHRLGIRPVKDELDDLALHYLDPVAYSEIENALEERKVDKDNFINSIKEQIDEEIKKNIKNYKIDGRVKSVSGIYNKMFKLNKSFDEIYDIYAVRVLVESIEECYLVLGEIHRMFIPVPNRFKDYINMPKPNGYQSLHTTVISKDDSRSVFEVQIRTFEMHKMAEYGVAAHWKYKVGGAVNDGVTDERLVWVRHLLENLKESGDVTEIFQQIKSDIMPEEVYAFTPKGDCKVLPLGSTVIDFAFAVHTEVGNRMTGAKINGNIVPITQTLNTGDFVEIMTTKDATRGPSRDWLNIVKTSEARTKIRSWFKRERREENITEGQFNLMREIKRNALGIGEDDIKDIIVDLSHKMSFDSLEDFYAAIGYGGITLSKIMPRIREAAQKRTVKTPETDEQAAEILKTVEPGNKVGEGVIVNGLSNVLIKFSKCCNPLPGDKIIGFVTRGFGVSIHKRDCTNVPKNIEDAPEPGRWVEALWSSKSLNNEYKTSILIYSADRSGLLADITMKLAGMRINIHSFNSRETKDGHAFITATFSTRGIEHIDQIISNLKKIDGIISIERANG